MARLDQMTEWDRKHLEDLKCPTFETIPGWKDRP